MLKYSVTMKNKNKLKLLLALMLAAMPIAVQSQDTDALKRDARTRYFKDFLMYWSDWRAYESVSHMDKRRAERTTYEEASARIPELVRDSTLRANKLTQDAGIINKKYDLDERPDHIYTWYELFYIYEQKKPDKNSEEYIMAENLVKYIETLKQLKLNRYTMQVNSPQK